MSENISQDRPKKPPPSRLAQPNQTPAPVPKRAAAGGDAARTPPKTAQQSSAPVRYPGDTSAKTPQAKTPPPRQPASVLTRQVPPPKPQPMTPPPAQTPSAVTRPPSSADMRRPAPPRTVPAQTQAAPRRQQTGTGAGPAVPRQTQQSGPGSAPRPAPPRQTQQAAPRQAPSARPALPAQQSGVSSDTKQFTPIQQGRAPQMPPSPPAPNRGDHAPGMWERSGVIDSRAARNPALPAGQTPPAGSRPERQQPAQRYSRGDIMSGRVPEKRQESPPARQRETPPQSGQPTGGMIPAGGQHGIQRDGRRNFGSNASAFVAPAPSTELAVVPSSESPEKDTGEKSKPARKSIRLGVMGAVLYCAFVIGVSALLATFIWVSANDVLALMKEDLTVSIEITQQDDIDTISEKLSDAKIIQYPFLFRLYCSLSDSGEEIDPGSYEINSSMDYHAIVNAMSDTSQFRSTISVTIPEGYESKHIFALLESKGVSSAAELADAAANYDFDYEFLKDIPKGKSNRLEGFLFPDTYEFYVNEKPATALRKFLSTFNLRYTAEMRTRAKDMGLTISQAVTIASLIEKEAALSEERPIISSVIHNRLDSSKFPRLEIDATIQYILPQRKPKLSNDDLKIDNPYNTYMYEGLPPGPIASPGLSSLRAALNPSKTSYYFYALDSEGTHKFSKTKSEHEEFLKQHREAEANNE